MNEDTRCTGLKMLTDPTQQKEAITRLCKLVHQANKNWWIDLDTGQPKQRNVGELLMLITSELSEGLEGHRKNLSDDKLPHRKMLEVELADAVIRIFDTAEGLGLDLGGAFVEKMQYNAQRADHKIENRKLVGGVKY
jgi:NTP pyrophosphatase (non-canonical NTP hydrolase)